MTNKPRSGDKLKFLFKEKEPFLAMAKRLWLSQEISGVKPFVEAKYNLKIKNLWVMAWGYNNIILLAQTDRGKVTIRFSQRERTGRDLEFESEVAQKLHQSGIPVRVPLVSEEGKLFYRISGGYALQVQTYLEGSSKPPKFLKSHLTSSAELLAQLHSVGRAREFEYIDRSFDAGQVVRESSLRLTETKNIPAEFLREIGWKAFFIEVEDFFDRFAEIWKRTRDTVRVGLVHGDFNPSNLVFDEEKVVGVLDFERAGWGPQIFDVGFAVAQWSFHNNRWSPLTVFDDFVESYTGVGRLESQELARMMTLLAVAERLGAAIHFYEDYQKKSHWKNEMRYFMGKFEKFWAEFGKIKKP